MTVGELKEYLTQFPDDAKVVTWSRDDEMTVEATAVEINANYEVSIS